MHSLSHIYLFCILGEWGRFGTIHLNNGEHRKHGFEKVFHATGQIGVGLGSIMQLHSDCFNQSEMSSM